MRRNEDARVSIPKQFEDGFMIGAVFLTAKSQTLGADPPRYLSKAENRVDCDLDLP
jgi:hypothetical protein